MSRWGGVYNIPGKEKYDKDARRKKSGSDDQSMAVDGVEVVTIREEGKEERKGWVSSR